MSKHTPGPWIRHEGEVRHKSHGLICRSYYGSPDGVGAANVRLIAAAPDLLEALRIFASCASTVSSEIDDRGHSWSEAYLDQALPIARAAIAKATGGAA